MAIDVTGQPYSRVGSIDPATGLASGFGVAGASAGGVSSTARIASAAASTNATSVKATPGRVYKIHGYNAAAAVRYLKLYNKATAPTVGTDVPVRTLALLPTAVFNHEWSDLGYYFSTGIALAFTVQPADADTSALTAADILSFNIDYA